MTLNYKNPVSFAGNQLTKLPKITANKKKWDTWLLENAINEAKITNNDFALSFIENINIPLKGKYSISNADYCTIHLILFNVDEELVKIKFN